MDKRLLCRSRSPALIALLTLLGLTGCAPTPVSATASRRARPAVVAAPYRARAGAVVDLGNDSVQLLAGGPPAFAAIGALIAGARRSVQVEMYEFGRPDLVAALIAAYRRGVAVTVIGDPSVDVTENTATTLRAAGVDVLDYPVRSMMIDHVKLLIVDGSVGVVGGINWGAASALNHDFDARVTGRAANNLQAVFLRDIATCGRVTGIPPPVPDPSVLVAATLPSADIRPLILGVIENAHTSLHLQLFVLTDVGIVHALERAAQRGVDVQLLVDPSQRPSDGPVAALRSHGVPVRLYRTHGELLHAKAMVADGRTVLLGSANWSAGGFARNHELDIELPDSPVTAADMLIAMRADWRASATMGTTGTGAVAPEAA